jgi:fatty-acyl-CoA synthase
MNFKYARPASEAHDYQLSIGNLLAGSLSSASRNEIVYRDKRRYDYPVLAQRLARLANVLAEHGVAAGTTVGVMDWDSHRYLECYFAVPMLGAVLLTINVRLAPDQVAYTIAHAQCETLLVHEDFRDLWEKVAPRPSAVRTVIWLRDDSDGTDPSDYETLMDQAQTKFDFPDIDERAIATTFYTTGTTGAPKAVCFTHRQIVLHTLAATGPFGAQRERGFGVDDVYMPMTPMFHVHAWGSPYVATMLGVKQVYPGRYDPALMLDLRQREKVTYSHCVPTILRMLLDVATARNEDLSGWHIVVGGAALTPGLAAEARGKGIDILAGYGMSETAPMVALALVQDAGRNGAKDISQRRGMKPVPLVQVRIVDEAMNDVPHDGQSQGELILRAPWLTPCYRGDQAASDTLWKGGWLHTQDVATINPSGRIMICDRIKDVIKTGGEWISSTALEQIIAEDEAVAEVAVIGVPDAKWSERPAAFVVPRRDQVPSLEVINARIQKLAEQGGISRFARLERLEIIGALPRTSVGKIDKKSLRVLLG